MWKERRTKATTGKEAIRHGTFEYLFPTHSDTIHGTGIFTYIWLIFMGCRQIYNRPMDDMGLEMGDLQKVKDSAGGHQKELGSWDFFPLHLHVT